MRLRVHFFIILGLLLFGAIVGGCKSPAVVVAPVAHSKDSARIEYMLKLDSVYIDRWHTIIQKGDTMYKIDSIYVSIFRNIETHDTISMQQTDTITVQQYIEKPISGGSKFLIWSGAAAWVIIGIIMIALFVAAAIRLRRV